MSKAEQKKLLGGIFTVVIFLIGLWQISTNTALTDPDTEDDKPGIIFTVPEGYAPFSRVVDGDTIEIAYSETDKYKVRLIGINTPESVDPRKPVECFGKEATEHLKKLLAVSYVRLSPDVSQQSEDVYGRWLRYVYLEDGTDINLQMIRDGYAYEYTYDTPYVNQDEYRAAESEARNKKVGLWSAETCNGKL